MLIVVTVLLSDLIPLRDRGTYQGYLNLIGALGSTSGGPLGTLLLHMAKQPSLQRLILSLRRLVRSELRLEMVSSHYTGAAHTDGYRRIFLIQVILCLLAMVLVSFLLRLPRPKSELSWKDQLKRVDFLGALLLILIVFGLLFGLDRGTHLSWQSPAAIVSLCATVPLLVAFLWVEIRFAVEPFTPGHVVFDKALFACYAQNFFGYAGFTALVYYIPFYFQVVLTMTPAQAGAGLIPAAISAVVGTLLGGIILKRIGKFYWLALISSSVGALASIPIALAPSLHSGSLITICVTSVASFVPQGITVTASLIAISRFGTKVLSDITDRRSFQCFSRRPGSCYSMLVPVPFARGSSWRLTGRLGHR